MKKSEVLKMLANFIYDDFGLGYHYGGEDLAMEYAKQILKRLENMGMQPPKDPILLTNKWDKE